MVICFLFLFRGKEKTIISRCMIERFKFDALIYKMQYDSYKIKYKICIIIYTIIYLKNYYSGKKNY